MPAPARLARALGTAGVVVLAVLAAGAGGIAAAPATVSADAPDSGEKLHGDPIPAAQMWSAAGAPIEALAAPRAALPPPGCVEYRASDDIANEDIIGNGPKWHMVIAVPADVRASTGYNNGGKEALYVDAVQAVYSMREFFGLRLGVGDVGDTHMFWTLRLDYGTSCGSQFPDVSIYNLPRTQAQYGTEPFYKVTADLDASNLYQRSDKRYVVHYAGASIYCGESYIYPSTDSTGGAKYSLVYNHHTLALGGTDLPCDWTTDAHEIGHSMGAATGGPLNNDDAHTWDCSNDVMSYGGPVCGDGLLYFDYKHNNYFDHPGSWNDTKQSQYWCRNNVC